MVDARIFLVHSIRWNNTRAYLTFVAQTKHVVTTFEITFIKFFVSCITLSTLVKVAAFPTVGFFTVNWSCCTYVGTRSRFSKSSFLCGPPGTCTHAQHRIQSYVFIRIARQTWSWFVSNDLIRYFKSRKFSYTDAMRIFIKLQI